MVTNVNAINGKLLAAGIRACLALLWTAAPVSAEQPGTAEQARAMLGRAVTALNFNGARHSTNSVIQKNKSFMKGDLYVFLLRHGRRENHTCESHALLNTDVRTLALRNDPIGKRAYEAVRTRRRETSSRLITSARSPARPSRFENKHYE